MSSFGKQLLKKKIISENDLKEVLAIKLFRKEKIGRLLLELGIIDEKTLNNELCLFLKAHKNINALEFLKSAQSSSILTKEEESLLRKHKALLIKKDKNKILCAVKIFSDKTIKALEVFYNRPIDLKVLDFETYELIKNERGISFKIHSEITATKIITDEEKLEENNPYCQIIKESIDSALKDKASDIHFEPFSDKFLIRHRVFGSLKEFKILESHHKEPLLSKLKTILNMDLSIVGKPQDQRASFESRKLDVRASSIPIVGMGEKIVLRLQKQDQEFELDSLGLSKKSHEVLLSNIKKKEGLILISGPTGSGKTTTLYSLLCKMDKFKKNISTIENPVEKKLDRINQVHLEDYKSFSDFERALMRQDPDIILVGEVRDSESASLCMKLSSTGHLVLSTIHANGATEVIERLKNLGVDNYALKSNLRLSVAQRLLPKICDNCSIKINRNEAQKILNQNLESVLHYNFRRINPKGCESCNSGVTGRIAILEVLEKKDILNFIKNPDSFKKPASLKDEALKRASLGDVDINEVLFFNP